MALLWVSFGLCGVFFFTSVMLFVDGRGQRKARSRWENATEAQLRWVVAQLFAHAGRLEALENGGGAPPSAAALARSTDIHDEPTLVSARDARDAAATSDKTAIPWERLANLSGEEIAALDALAARLGISRENVLHLCAQTGLDHLTPETLIEAILEDRARRARPAGPTAPPELPGDDRQSPPPPSGKRRS